MFDFCEESLFDLLCGVLLVLVSAVPRNHQTDQNHNHHELRDHQHKKLGVVIVGLNSR